MSWASAGCPCWSTAGSNPSTPSRAPRCFRICNATYNDSDRSSSLILTPDNRELSPNEWLLDVLFRPEQADTYQVIAIDNPDLLSLLNLRREDGMAQAPLLLLPRSKRPSPRSIAQAQLAEPVDPQTRSIFQKAVVQLQANVILYLRLKQCLISPDSPDFLTELFDFQKTLAAGVEAVRAKQAGQPFDAAAARHLIDSGQQFDQMSRLGYALAIPPAKGEADVNGWRNAGTALLESFQTGQVNPHVLAYAGLGHSWAGNKPTDFNNILRLYREELVKGFPHAMEKCATEARFNAMKPFTTAMSLYVMAFFIAIFSWLILVRGTGPRRLSPSWPSPG